jgi:CRP/FNR family cyclic AMP-dependent transcriptional regulator
MNMSSPLVADSSVFEEMLTDYAVHQMPKNRTLLYQGEIPTMAFYIKKGIVKIYNITAQGEEKVVGYGSHGDFMPVEWLFSRAPVSLYYYDTFTDCELIRLPQPEVMNLLQKNHKASLLVLERSVSMYIAATVHLHALEQSRARNKLLYIFQYLVLRFGKTIDETHSRIDLKLTHQEIANLIGTSRETTSTEISKLSKEGVVRIKNLQYVVDTDKALRLLGETDFSELSL